MATYNGPGARDIAHRAGSTIASGDRRSHTRWPRSAQERAAATAAGFGGPPPLPRAIVACDWRPIDPPRNTLRGWLSLRLPSGLVLRECSLHVQSDNRRWIGLPARPQLDAEGRHRTDPATGKKQYAPVVEIPGTAARTRFQAAALAAVDRLLEAER